MAGPESQTRDGVQNVRTRFMETSIFVTDLAQQFSLSVVGPSHPVVVPLGVVRVGRRGFFDPRSFVSQTGK